MLFSVHTYVYQCLLSCLYLYIESKSGKTGFMFSIMNESMQHTTKNAVCHTLTTNIMLDLDRREIQLSS